MRHRLAGSTEDQREASLSAAEIYAIAQADPVRAINNLNCPADLFWQLAEKHPWEAFVSPAFTLLFLESPDRFFAVVNDFLTGALFDGKMQQALWDRFRLLSPAQKARFQADILHRFTQGSLGSSIKEELAPVIAYWREISTGKTESDARVERRAALASMDKLSKQLAKKKTPKEQLLLSCALLNIQDMQTAPGSLDTYAMYAAIEAVNLNMGAINYPPAQQASRMEKIWQYQRMGEILEGVGARPDYREEHKRQRAFWDRLRPLLIADGAVDNTPTSVYGWAPGPLKPRGYDVGMNTVNASWIEQNETSTSDAVLTATGLAETLVWMDVCNKPRQLRSQSEEQAEVERLSERFLLLFAKEGEIGAIGAQYPQRLEQIEVGGKSMSRKSRNGGVAGLSEEEREAARLTEEAIRESREAPARAASNPHTPKDYLFALAKKYPLEVYHNPVKILLDLEDPSWWERVCIEHIGDWCERFIPEWSFVKQQRFVADCMEHLLPRIENPAKRKIIESVIEVRRTFDEGFSQGSADRLHGALKALERKSHELDQKWDTKLLAAFFFTGFPGTEELYRVVSACRVSRRSAAGWNEEAIWQAELLLRSLDDTLNPQVGTMKRSKSMSHKFGPEDFVKRVKPKDRKQPSPLQQLFDSATYFVGPPDEYEPMGSYWQRKANIGHELRARRLEGEDSAVLSELEGQILVDLSYKFGAGIAQAAMDGVPIEQARIQDAVGGIEEDAQMSQKEIDELAEHDPRAAARNPNISLEAFRAVLDADPLAASRNPALPLFFLEDPPLRDLIARYVPDWLQRADWNRDGFWSGYLREGKRYQVGRTQLLREYIEPVLPHLGSFADHPTVKACLAHLFGRFIDEEEVLPSGDPYRSPRRATRQEFGPEVPTGKIRAVRQYANEHRTQASLRAYYAIYTATSEHPAEALRYMAYTVTGTAINDHGEHTNVFLWGWNRFLQICFDTDQQFVGGKQMDLFGAPKKPTPQIELISTAPQKVSRPKPVPILYAGQTRGAKTMKMCEEFGVRELTQRMVMPPKRTKLGYAIDNGCFVDHQLSRPFDLVQYIRKVLWWLYHQEEARARGQKAYPKPDFLVMPDVVYGGMDSLAFSKNFYQMEKGPDGHPSQDRRIDTLPWYFVVQNGMTPENIDLSWCPSFQGIFVGGGTEWKFEMAKTWVDYAHDKGWKCHIGRFVSPDAIAVAKEIGADSIDGNGPLWTEEGLTRAAQLLKE